ncbi:Cysteine-rich motor neuron 1 protein, partial [Orchesella cincta]
MSSQSHHRQNPHHRWSNNWNVRMMGMMIVSLFSLSLLLTSIPTAAAEEAVTVAVVDDTQATTPETLLPPAHNQIPGNCSQVKCPPVESCPEDSYRLPSLVEPVRQQGGVGNTCCPHSPSSGTTQNKCQCIPDLLCAPKECPQGLVAHVSKNATGKPGGCCPKFECLTSPLSGRDEKEILFLN